MMNYIRGKRIVYVSVPEEGGRISASDVATCLLRQLKFTGAIKDHGYVVVVTQLESIGRGVASTNPPMVIFPVTYYGRIFKPEPGDVMIGTVYRVCRTGVFLACGPVKVIYLSRQLMGGYSFVDGEVPFFLSGDQSRIEKDSVIRFKVHGARWDSHSEREPSQYYVLATILDPSLGLIQSPGDAMDLESLTPDE